MKLKKYSGNPIISPNPNNKWESLVTTNPGAWYDEETKEVKLLYRAAGNDKEHLIHLGLATSKNGYDFERVSDQPVLSPSVDGYDAGCIEDPRIVKFGDYYFITYACRSTFPGQYWLNENYESDAAKEICEEAPIALRNNLTRTGLALSKDLEHYYRIGCLTDPRLDDRDVILFPDKVGGKFVTLHRPKEYVGELYGCTYPSMWIAYSDDLLEPKKLEFLATAKYDWEVKIGGSTPPIKTEYGWLTLYHAVGNDKKYRVGAFLLDLENPSKILYRTYEPILEPEYGYENEGIYKGICFPCGNVVIDDTLFVYYGGADQYVAVATCEMTTLLDYLLSCPYEN